MLSLYTANWILPVSAPPISDGALIVEDELIVDVGPRTEIIAKYAGRISEARHFEYSAILPGFVNTHTHFELTLLRGSLEGLGFREWLLGIIRLKEMLTLDDLLISAKLGAIEAIRAGITTIADACESGIVVDALNESGQRGIVYQEVFGVDPVAAEDSLKGLGEKIVVLQERAGSKITVGVSPHSPYTVSPKLFSLVTEYAMANELPMAIHAAESIAEDSFVRINEGEFAESYARRGIEWQGKCVSTIEYLRDLGVLKASPLLIHCVQTTADDLEFIRESKSKIAHCPKSNAKFGHGIAPLPEMISAGIQVGLGTDSVVSNNVCDLIDEARTACLMARAVTRDGSHPSAKDMIRIATLGGAEAVGMQGSIGSLESGKQADFCVLNLNQIGAIPVSDPETAIMFSASASNVSATAVAGRFLFEAGQVDTLDETEIRRSYLALADKFSKEEM
jgi:cytosine/adenosine deaminase-related metal-dependent hydrolase